MHRFTVRDSPGIFTCTGSQSEIVQVYLCTQLHRFTFRDSPGIFMYSQRESRYIYVQLHMFTVRDSPGIFMYTAAQVLSQG